MASELVFSSIGRSNISHQGKSAIRRWYDGITGTSMARARGHVVESGHAIRQGSESLLTGALLGAAHVELKDGLDMHVGKNKVPLDAAVGVLGMLGGVAMVHEGVGADLRNAGASGFTIFAFRKTYDYMAERKRLGGGVPGGALKAHGDFDAISSVDDGFAGDPIVEAAKSL